MPRTNVPPEPPPTAVVVPNVVSGRVVLKGTGVGIPDLIVVLYDVDPGTKPEELIPGNPLPVASSSSDGSLGIGDRIGSRLTDAAGAFELSYDDDEARIRNPGETRPDLWLSVLAPEEPGVAPDARVLYSSPQVRQGAGRTEQYLIRLPGELLTKAGIPLPIDPKLPQDQPEKAAGRLDQAITLQNTVEQETRRIAADQVTAVREQAQQTDTVIEAKLFESLTGLTPEEAERRRIVPPNAKPEPLVWKTVNEGIDNVINPGGPIAGYIVVSQEQADKFKDADGDYRDDIPAEEIEPFLYQGDTVESRPAYLLRTDPAALACKSQVPDDPFGDPPPSDPPPVTLDGNGGDPVTEADLPTFVGRLLDPMVAPEDDAIVTRPDADDVQSSVDALQLRSGPADVTAFHDFHQLQIAFDYVLQQAIDQNVIDAGKALGRQLIDRGGDPIGSLDAGNDAIETLRAETRHVGTARTSLQSAGIAFGKGIEATDAVFHTGPFKPPFVQPPFVDGGVVFNGPGGQTAEPEDLLSELDDALRERYKFEIFAPGSTNFGLLVSYRQQWEPITYQVGDMVKTITLTPKETRKVSSKRVIKRERSVKELQENQRIRKDEMNDTSRDEAEIVQKAQDKTSFNLTAKGSFDIGISSGDSTTSLTRDAESASSEVKKSFRESVLKAAQEFKDERKLEVETKSSDELEVTESAEIVNPNDELTVTYLFYELQRRYRISESIHRLTPVVLVAMEVPNPSRREIDKVLLSHAWIINRVLLDDRYRPALEYLSCRVVGDELALRELQAKVGRIQTVVNQLTQMHKEIEATLTARELALQAAIEQRAKGVEHEDNEGFFDAAWDAVVGSGDETDLEAARIREDSAKEAYERSVREEKDLRMRLDAETAALDAATDAYAKAYAEHANHLLEVAALRVHFKENVLYYMQAIWSHTYQDEIFFSLFKVSVPRLTAKKKTYGVAAAEPLPVGVVSQPGEVVLAVHVEVELDSGLEPETDMATLAEVADLDQPLGCKGNYMIFPLKQSNALTDFMMVPYVDSALGLRDPDDLANWTPESFASYARCVLDSLKDELPPEEFEALKTELERRYKLIVSNPRPSTDEIVVPTSSLYIEGLPGVHPLIEDFKLLHRHNDVKRAHAETRKLEMENVRYAARILGEELADPEVDKQVIFTGPPNGAVVES
jgi:hypothetical protein